MLISSTVTNMYIYIVPNTYNMFLNTHADSLKCLQTDFFFQKQNINHSQMMFLIYASLDIKGWSGSVFVFILDMSTSWHSFPSFWHIFMCVVNCSISKIIFWFWIIFSRVMWILHNKSSHQLIHAIFMLWNYQDVQGLCIWV